MITVVGIKYLRAGRVYYFNPNGLELHVGDAVVVDTARGAVLATVTQIPRDVNDDEVVQPLKNVLRIATFEDIKAHQGLKEREDKAIFECAAIIKRLGLPMNLVTAEYNLDRSRLIIYFGAEGRVDFRELVKELNRTLRTLVELRQIGPRDEAKLIGGYGRCGRQLCCEGFLTDFHPVSIKMAKEQNLPLNSTKISGVCSRLLCCLGYEYSQYKEQNRRMPKRNSTVESPAGPAVVVSCKPMEELVTVRTENEALLEFALSDLKFSGQVAVEIVSGTDEDIISDEELLVEEINDLEDPQVLAVATTDKRHTNQLPRSKDFPQSPKSKTGKSIKTKVSENASETPAGPRSPQNVEERKNRNYRRLGEAKREENLANQASSGAPRRKFYPKKNQSH